MKNLIKNKAFVVGFTFGIVITFLVNFYTLLPERGFICFDCYETWGFPFAMHESGTMLHLNRFIWAGVIANISIAIVFSSLLGLVSKFIWSKLASKNLR